MENSQVFQITIDGPSFSPEVHIAHYMEFPAGLDIKPRIIEDFEWVLVTKGEGEYELPEQTIQYQAPALILTPPYRRHSYKSNGSPSAHYALHFDLAPAYSRCFRCPPSSFDRPVRIRYIDSRIGALLDLQEYNYPASPLFEGLFKKAIHWHGQTIRNMALSSSFRTNAALAEIYALVLETCTCPSPQCQEERLRKAALVIESRCNENLTLLDLAREAGYAENYFSGEFRRLYGLSPMEYLREQRLSLAKKLLCQGTLSIKEVAHASGFHDPLYFSKVFSHRMGVNPSAYRKLALPVS